jgi:hypothetical protein
MPVSKTHYFKKALLGLYMIVIAFFKKCRIQKPHGSLMMRNQNIVILSGASIIEKSFITKCVFFMFEKNFLFFAFASNAQIGC